MKSSVKQGFLALLTLALLLTACGNAGGNSPFQKKDDNTLIFASFQPFGVDQEVKQAIDDFNHTHTDVQIEIRDYWGETYEDGRQGRQRLLTEIGSGKMPDILDLGYNCGDIKMLPYRRMVMWDYLEDLWPYIENDPDLGREKLFETPLKAAEVDGGLYMVFNSVKVNTYVGAVSRVGDRASWTMEDVMEVYQTMPENSTVFEFDWTRQKMLEKLLSMCLDSYVDWETGTPFFDCDNFRMILEFCKGFPEGEEVKPEDAGFGDLKAMAEYDREIKKRLRQGQQMLDLWDFNMSQIQILDRQFGEPFSFIGYPVEDGSVGSAFTPARSRLVMSSVCKNKEAAWEVIRQVLLPRYASQEEIIEQGSVFVMGGIPIYINLSDYDLVKQAYMSDALEDEEFLAVAMIHEEYHPVTSEECRRFEDFITSIEKVDLYDSDLLDIVMECAEPYFLGDKTLDETIAIIQNRTALYVNEIR